MQGMNRVYNFSPGPAMMPLEVLQKAAAELPDFNGSGMSVVELSHRGKVFAAEQQRVESRLREVLGVPGNYKVLFLQGGATLQFSQIPMNLLYRSGEAKTADYAVTGNFAGNAYKEASRYGAMRLAWDGKAEGFARIPKQGELDLNPDAAYFHYCHNNTVYGSRWTYIPETGNVPLVCDMSSSILSEPVDVSRFGLIYAGAQKNMGVSGLTVVLVRDDLLEGQTLPGTPTYMDYRVQAKNDSCYNTPPTFAVYMLGLVLDWVAEQGGLNEMKRRNEQKAKLLYDVLDSLPAVRTVIAPEDRSLMNVTFNLGDPDRDKAFVAGANARGLSGLAGHRATGGMRASIYNAMPLQGVEKLAAYLKEAAV
jgi:phosphoserine aminotransferase